MDAPLSGWGGHSPHKSVQGTWSLKFQSFHINILEAMAVFSTLEKINPEWGSRVRLMLGSDTIVRCLNRNGSRSPQINLVILAILSLASKRSRHLSAAHIAGVRNVLADSLSRDAPPPWSPNGLSTCAHSNLSRATSRTFISICSRRQHINCRSM